MGIGVGRRRRKLSPTAAEVRLSGGRELAEACDRREGWEAVKHGGGGPHLRVHVVRRVTEEAAGRVLVQVHGLVDDGDAIVDVTHLVTHRRLVRGEAPLIIHDKLVLVRACGAEVFVERAKSLAAGAARRAWMQWQVMWCRVSAPAVQTACLVVGLGRQRGRSHSVAAGCAPPRR